MVLQHRLGLGHISQPEDCRMALWLGHKAPVCMGQSSLYLVSTSLANSYGNDLKRLNVNSKSKQ